MLTRYLIWVPIIGFFYWIFTYPIWELKHGLIALSFYFITILISIYHDCQITRQNLQDSAATSDD